VHCESSLYTNSLPISNSSLFIIASAIDFPDDGDCVPEVTSPIIKRDEFEMGRELLVQVRKRQLKAKIVKKNQIDK
jgi:aminomethyltransferase